MSLSRWGTTFAVFLISSSLHFLSVSAIGVTANSPCGASCVDNWADHGNISSAYASYTVATDFVCRDSDLKLTSQGRKWTACLGCESTSSWWQPANPNDRDPSNPSKHADAENDIFWFLHGIEATLVACIYGTAQQWGTADPNDPSQNSTYSTATACASACQGIHNSLVQNLTVGINSSLQYDYCDNFDGAFLTNSNTCKTCLDGLEDAKTLSRYIGTLNTACSTRPNATLGQSISSTDYFANTTLSTSAATSTSSSAPSSSPSASSSSGLSTGAKAGIGVGVALGALVLLALLGFFLMRRRRQRRSAVAPEFEAEETSASPPVQQKGIWDPAAGVWRQGRHEMEGDLAPQIELRGSEPQQSEIHGKPIQEKQSETPPVEMPAT